MPKIFMKGVNHEKMAANCVGYKKKNQKSPNTFEPQYTTFIIN